MSISNKQNIIQTYQIVLYRRALHPDLFPLKGRRTIRHGQYELESWVMPGAHLLRFERRGFCICELLTEHERSVPTAGIVTSFLCGAEKDFEQSFERDGMNYMTTVQTENLPTNLYRSTFDEILDVVKESQALAHTWDDEVGRCMSVVDVQRYSREAHIQTYHFLASLGLVLRSQTIFEHT